MHIEETYSKNQNIIKFEHYNNQISLPGLSLLIQAELDLTSAKTPMSVGCA